jgi:ABC-2 type transport system ATP-binding protein
VIVLSTHQADDIAAICQRVVVLLEGRVRFSGTPAELADLAAGQVWTADRRDESAYLSWRGSDGRWRHISAAAPAGVEMVAPTVEDGYLQLCHTASVQ